MRQVLMVALLLGGLWNQLDAEQAADEIAAQKYLQQIHEKGNRTPRIAHHRGASHHAPENTLAGLEKSIRMGADLVEFDVRTSADGEFFILHDSTLDRTTTGKGPIALKPAAAIGELTIESRFGSPEGGTRVPTLDEFLAKVGDRIELYVDAKDIPPEKLVEKLRAHGLIKRSIVYQGEDYLARLKEIEPALRRMPPLDSIDAIDGLVDRLAPYAFDTDWKVLSKELIDQCHKHGALVFSDALGWHERPAEYRRAAAMGIDVIQTDFPLRVLEAFAVESIGVSK